MTLHTTLQLGSRALQTSVDDASDVQVSAEQRTMSPEGKLDVTLRARGQSLDALEEGFDADGTVARWTLIGGTESWRVYRTRLSEGASASMNYDAWTGGRAVFPSAIRTDRGWRVEAYMPNRTVLQQFAAECKSHDVKLDLVCVEETAQPGGAKQFGLTDLQAKTLLEALERGYYTVPREANLEAVAEPLGVSHQALSERLRRGVGSLIRNTIADQWVGDERLGASEDESTTTDVSYGQAPIERSIALTL